MTTDLKIQQRLVFFIGIGGFAALVHLSLVFAFVHGYAMRPLLANILGYGIAFNVSFFGHRYLTFSNLKDQKTLRLPHFFLVASSGALINELLYYLFLRYTPLNYLTALVLVLGLVAVYSFLMSRYWACR